MATSLTTKKLAGEAGWFDVDDEVSSRRALVIQTSSLGTAGYLPHKTQTRLKGLVRKVTNSWSMLQGSSDSSLSSAEINRGVGIAHLKTKSLLLLLRDIDSQQKNQSEITSGTPSVVRELLLAPPQRLTLFLPRVTHGPTSFPYRVFPAFIWRQCASIDFRVEAFGSQLPLGRVGVWIWYGRHVPNSDNVGKFG